MKRYRLLILVLVVTFVAVQLQGCATNPVTGESELAFMSKSQEIDIGQKHYPIMTQVNNGELQDSELQRYVQRIGEQIVEVSHRPNLPYEFNIVNSSTINAYALPGGKISVTRGLLLEMDQEEELAAVIGHEIAHVTARHAVQQQSRSVLTNVFLTAGSVYMKSEGVAYAGLYENLGQIGAGALLASYSRSQEQQADRLGIEYMAKAGYDPQGMVELQQILLEKRESEPGMVQQIFSSHPLSEDRISDSKKRIAEVRSNVQIPSDKRLRSFEGRVASTWKPRKPAYKSMDGGIKSLSNENTGKGIEQFNEAISKFSREALFHAWKGKALTLKGEKQAGRSALDKALSLNSNVFRIRMFSGINYFKIDNHKKSLNELETANGLIPKVPDVIFYRGRNHEELNNRDRAAHFYKQYLEKVKKGEKAQYCANRLQRWGRI